MYVILEPDHTATISEITLEELEILQNAIMAYIANLPPETQPPLRRLAMQIDKLL